MFPNSDTLSWFRDDQSLLIFLNAACVVEKQYIPMAGALCLRHLWLETYVSDTYGWRPMSQTPMAGDLCLRHLWLETYVSDTYGWRPMSQTPMAEALCLRHLWLEPYVSDTYGWSPMSQTPMAGDLCLRHLWLEPYVSDTYGWSPMSQTPSVSDNHTLIDRLISYALYVVPSYELCCFSDTINLSGDLWCQTPFMYRTRVCLQDHY
jgi:hypothetical protein